jgi:hypothetical protein
MRAKHVGSPIHYILDLITMCFGHGFTKKSICKEAIYDFRIWMAIEIYSIVMNFPTNMILVLLNFQI